MFPKNITVNKERYLELHTHHLMDCFTLYKSEVFQQDCAPAHTAKLVRDWLEWVSVDFIREWPGNSPDLNPIENLWGLIKRCLRGCDTSTVPKLVMEIQNIWECFEPSFLQILNLLVPQRLQSFVKRKGNRQSIRDKVSTP